MNRLEYYTKLRNYEKQQELKHSCYYENLGKMKHKILTAMKQDFKKNIPDDASDEEIEEAWKKFKDDNYDSYYEEYKENKIQHAGTANYKYYAKEDLGNGKSRYYYSRAEWEAAHRNSGSAADRAAEEAARRNAWEQTGAANTVYSAAQRQAEEDAKKRAAYEAQKKMYSNEQLKEKADNKFNEELKKQDELRDRMKDWKSKHDEETKSGREKQYKILEQKLYDNYQKEHNKDYGTAGNVIELDNVAVKINMDGFENLYKDLDNNYNSGGADFIFNLAKDYGAFKGTDAEKLKIGIDKMDGFRGFEYEDPEKQKEIETLEDKLQKNREKMTHYRSLADNENNDYDKKLEYMNKVYQLASNGNKLFYQAYLLKSKLNKEKTKAMKEALEIAKKYYEDNILNAKVEPIKVKPIKVNTIKVKPIVKTYENSSKYWD